MVESCVHLRTNWPPCTASRWPHQRHCPQHNLHQVAHTPHLHHRCSLCKSHLSAWVLLITTRLDSSDAIVFWARTWILDHDASWACSILHEAKETVRISHMCLSLWRSNPILSSRASACFLFLVIQQINVWDAHYKKHICANLTYILLFLSVGCASYYEHQNLCHLVHFVF